MIDQVDKRIAEWVENVLDGATVSLHPPDDAQSGQGVSLYLLELADSPPPRSTGRPPLQLSLRYLVTTWAEEPKEAHRLLGELVFAGMGSSEFDIELDPIPVDLWASLGVAPRPSFILRTPLRMERPEPEVKYVRQPLVVRTVSITSLRGTVLGPDDVPLVGALVEIPALELFTRTDAKGVFSFSTLPAEPLVEQVLVRAKGREFSVTVDQPVSEDRPLVIRIDPLDGRES
jgi:hypothetical protein